jgi:hypothetical protein
MVTRCLQRPSRQFTIVSPRARSGRHQCFLLAPSAWCVLGDVPLALAKEILENTLKALDFLHVECKLIHTDLKLDNILFGFADDNVLAGYMTGAAMVTNTQSQRPSHSSSPRTASPSLGHHRQHSLRKTSMSATLELGNPSPPFVTDPSGSTAGPVKSCVPTTLIPVSTSLASTTRPFLHAAEA